MKKILCNAIISIFLMAMTAMSVFAESPAILDVGSFMESGVSEEITEKYNISYYRPDYASITLPYKDLRIRDMNAAIKIKSYEELEGLFEPTNKIAPDYDEAFFDDKFLVIVHTIAPQGSYIVRVTSVSETEKAIYIGAINKGEDGVLSHHAVEEYAIVFEMNRESEDKIISASINGIKIDTVPAKLGTASEWAQKGIVGAYGKGFVPDELNNSYQSDITRQEFCRLTVKFMEYVTDRNVDELMTARGLFRDPASFTDTNDSDILSAYALGIANGVGDKLFDPEGLITREQAATMIMNTCKALGTDVDNSQPAEFADMDEASSWAYDGINFVGANRIMQGTGAGYFSPKAMYSVEESIVTFNNLSAMGFLVDRQIY